MRGFWDTLKRPYMVLAPMADVTDSAFRQIINKYGKPDVMWTEFVSVEGLCSAGRDRLIKDLYFVPEEQPLIAQIFGTDLNAYKETAAMCADLGFAGIDINMGCPVNNIIKDGSGSAMCKNPDHAIAVTRAAKEGARNIPVSVKIRLGWNQNEIETWLPRILEAEPAVVSIHCRTRAEMSKVPADWTQIKRAVEIRNNVQGNPDENPKAAYIIGNGDVANLKDADVRVSETGCDGVMIGRGVFGDPWLFNREIDKENIPYEERFRVLIEHIELYQSLYHDVKNFAIMRKHFGSYVAGYDQAKRLKIELMDTTTAEGAIGVLQKEIENLK